MNSASQLLQRYQKFHGQFGTPDWAFQVEPPTPLVGEGYSVGNGLLVYGSAENLTHDIASSAKSRWERHRLEFNSWKSESQRGFPEMHCQPITDGGLLMAAAFVLTLAGKAVPEHSHVFLEKIAAGNFGKFSIAAKNNIDYAGRVRKLESSLPYVFEDITILKPAILMLPLTTYRVMHSRLEQLLRNTRVIAAYQCQPQVLNVHLGKKYDHRASVIREKYSQTTWGSWIEDVAPRVKSGMWRYLAHIEDVWNN